MRTLILTLLVSFLLLVYEVKAQSSYYFRHFQVEDGLSNNTVLCSRQDTKGFMWFGTLDGLNRFDGYSFKTFRHNSTKQGSIGNNSIQSLLAAENGCLWVGTQKGLYFFDAVTETFNVLPGTENISINSIAVDADKNIWYATDTKLYRYNTVSGKVVPYTQGFEITALCITNNNEVWVGTSEGRLKSYDRLTGRFVDRIKMAIPEPAKIVSFFDTGRGSLLLGTFNHTIYLFDMATGSIADIAKNTGQRLKLYTRDFGKYSDKEYWAATEDGLYIYNMATGDLKTLRRHYDNRYSISDNAVNTLCRDKEGGMWVGTRFGGINYYAHPYESFTKYFAQTGSNSISGNSVHEICPDNNGNIWIGTEDAGLNKLNKATGLFTHFIPDGNQGSVSSSNIHGLLVNGNHLWVGTFQYGIDVMDIGSGKVIKNYNSANSGLNDNFIVHLFKTKSSEIYAGTWKGLFKYIPAKDNFEPVNELQVQTQSIIEDDTGTLWICTLKNGVYIYDPSNRTIDNLVHEKGNTNSIASNMVNGLYRDSKGFFWFATEAGLSRYDPLKKNFATYTTSNGLPGNYIFKVLEDGDGVLWISTTNGLVTLNPETEKIKVFTTANGLLSNQFNWNSAYKDSSGKMYFGSAKGMISFVPCAFTTNAFTPPVYITGIQVHDREIVIGKEGSPLDKAIHYTAEIALPYNQSTFSIDFAALSFTSPGTNEYAYRMDGLDKDWTYLKSNRKAYFTELKPGNYTFRLKASNNSGVWNEKETTLVVRIMPPFWAGTWAYIVYTFMGMVIVSVVIRNYHKRTAEKNERRIEHLEHEKEKEIYQAKIEFFTNVAHEIRTPLTLIKGPMEKLILKSESLPDISGSLKIMERNTNRLIDLTNQLLDFRQTEIKGFRLNFTKVDVWELLQDIHSGFTPIAEQKNIDYRIETNSSNISAFVDADALNKIFSNLYSNAFKYASAKVYSKIIQNNDAGNFVFEIRSDGHLIPYEMKEKIFEPFFRLKETKMLKGTGIGLALSRSLAVLHKGTLDLAMPENDLNVFRLTLPLHSESENQLWQQTAELKQEPIM